MHEWRQERVGRYRPTVARRIPRAIPDERFNELFAALPSNRDRALVAFWISTGVRVSELLGVRQCDMDPGQQLVTVVRKGSRAIQVPASTDAFVMYEISLSVPGYDPGRGVIAPAEGGTLTVEVVNGSVEIFGDSAGYQPHQDQFG
jgi:site-specific recombinase XerC